MIKYTEDIDLPESILTPSSGPGTANCRVKCFPFGWISCQPVPCQVTQHPQSSHHSHIFNYKVKRSILAGQLLQGFTDCDKIFAVKLTKNPLLANAVNFVGNYNIKKVCLVVPRFQAKCQLV